MGFSHKYYFVDETGNITKIPLARYLRLYAREEALPAYAGRRVRCAEIMVEIEDRRPTGRLCRECYHLLPFDGAGKVDRKETFRSVRLALEAGPPLLPVQPRSVEQKNVIDAHGRFAAVQLAHEFHWEPGHQLRRRLLDLALGRKRGVQK